MKNKVIAIFALAAVLPFTAEAQTSHRITAGKASDYGLVYSLPLTALDIYIEAELTTEKPGDFHNYARRYLGVTDAVTKEKHSADVKSVTVIPRGVANPEERWVAQFKTGSTPYMLLSPEGVPLAINTDIPVEIIEPEIPEPVAAGPTALEAPEAAQAVTADMARSSSTGKKAELAAQRIFELREMRSDILGGQADKMPTDGAAMQLVLNNIAAQEAALTAMFTGTKSTSTVVERFTFMPDSSDVAGRVIARLSAVEGLVDADNLAGAPITLNLRVIEEGREPVNEKGEEKTFPKGGVAYCVPGTAEVTIDYAGRRVAKRTVDLAQIGVVFGLNPALFTDKKEPSKVLFDPATGSILTLGPAN